MSDVRVIARAPHPNPSAELPKVASYIQDRMRALGLQVSIQAAQRTYTNRAKDSHTADLTNLIGVMPGRNPAAPALLLMAHYDTVPGSPGAADDTSGVASELEIARIFKVRGQPERDVVFLITDGEELGLLGAKAFFASHPLVPHVGFVINMESRGGGGKAAMFETGDHDGAVISLFAHTARRPLSNSLSTFLYKKLPNDTDFTVSKALGIPGLNYAFIGRPGQYHSPTATPDALDQGALQSLGEQALASAGATAYAPALPAAAPDVVWGDVLGGPVLVYAPVFGWVILGIEGLLILPGLRGATIGGALSGAGAGVLMIAFAAVDLWALQHFAMPMKSRAAYYQIMRDLHRYEVAALIICFASALLAAFALRGKGADRGRHAGLLVLGLLLAVALQVAAPTTGFLFAWPLLIGALASALTSQRWPGAAWAALVGGTLTTALVLYWGHFVFQGIGPTLPLATAPFALLASFGLYPLLRECWTRTEAVDSSV